MSQAKGSAARFSYVNEVAWGTTPGSPSMKQLAAAVYGESLGGQMGEIQSNAIRNTRGRVAIRGGDFTVGGSVPFELAPLGLASIFKALMGANTTSGAGPYTHVMKRGSLPAGMTIEKAFTDLGKYISFRGCLIDKMSLSINAENSLITGSLDVMGKDFVKAGASLGVPTAPVHDPFTEFEAAITEGGAGVTVLNFGLNFANEIERVAAIGTRYAAAMNEGNGTTDVSLTLMFDSDTILDKWINETQTSCQVTATSGAASAVFLLPKLKYFGDSIPKIQTSQGIVVELNGRAMYDSVEQTDLKVTFTNTEATI